MIERVAAVRRDEHKAVVRGVARGVRLLEPVVPAVRITVQQRDDGARRVALLGGQIIREIHPNAHRGLQHLAFQPACDIGHPFSLFSLGAAKCRESAFIIHDPREKVHAASELSN